MTRLELSRGRLRYLAKESLMPATLLATRRVDKPWGRHILWPGFPDPAPDGAPVGEVWFQTPGDANPDLLVKYLFTSEKLSVQVHPNAAAARKAGYPRGKDEAWLILAAEPARSEDRRVGKEGVRKGRIAGGAS